MTSGPPSSKYAEDVHADLLLSMLTVLQPKPLPRTRVCESAVVMEGRADF